MLKPALKIEDLFELAKRQKAALKTFKGKQKLYPVWTSRRPARQDELLDNGSVYWIIKKQISCRQRIVDVIEQGAAPGREKPTYLILCEPQLVQTQPYPKRPFQGWRYLKPENAPADAGLFDPDQDRPPPEMEKALKELGLI